LINNATEPLRDIEEVFELRMLLEPHAAKLAANRRSEEVIVQLRAYNEQTAELIKNGAVKIITDFEEINRNFHRTVLDNAGSPRLRAMLNTILEIPKTASIFRIYTHQQFEQNLNHYRDLTLAIESSDGDLAFQIMQSHLKIAYLHYIHHQKNNCTRSS
jgi:DNA-binding GntR family transcriptional regulator